MMTTQVGGRRYRPLPSSLRPHKLGTEGSGPAPGRCRQVGDREGAVHLRGDVDVEYDTRSSGRVTSNRGHKVEGTTEEVFNRELVI